MNMFSGYKRYWIVGTISVILLVFTLVWLKLPTISCYGVKYEWSREYSLSYLESIGPKAAGVLFEYNICFEGLGDLWNKLLLKIINSIRTEQDAQLFVSSLSDVNACAEIQFNQTPMHFAATAGHDALIKLLIAKGADCGVKDDNGEVPLGFAAMYGGAKVVNILLENGASLNNRNENGSTPLHGAVGCGTIETIQLLIEKGADVNISNKEGNTALHFASYFEIDNRDVAVSLLIEKGAFVNARRNFGSGQTPLDLAIELNRKRIMTVLRKHGGKTAKELDSEKLSSQPSSGS